MKYLIIKKQSTSECILFGSTMSHRELANSLQGCEVVGAGICGFDWIPETAEWEVYLFNGSESLGIDKCEDDKAYIKHALNEGNR